jgi:hypothetical protein
MQSVFWAPACSLKKRPKADGDPSRELQTLNLSKRSIEHGSLCSEWFKTMEATAISTINCQKHGRLRSSVRFFPTGSVAIGRLQGVALRSYQRTSTVSDPFCRSGAI